MTADDDRLVLLVVGIAGVLVAVMWASCCLGSSQLHGVARGLLQPVGRTLISRTSTNTYKGTVTPAGCWLIEEHRRSIAGWSEPSDHDLR